MCSCPALIPPLGGVLSCTWPSLSSEREDLDEAAIWVLGWNKPLLRWKVVQALPESLETKPNRGFVPISNERWVVSP